ncbi:MAG: hypothetical protein RG741_06910 [Bacteroidales bacterium]|nr:hypothetical protein [Bacteroidales bacterium]
MLVYKFKVSFEDQDDFLREIELRADQTFEDFHQAILGNLGLDPGMLASFFICDHRYRKQKEIQMVEHNNPVRAKKSEIEEDEPSDTVTEKAWLMKDNELKDVIDDPHQRLLFLYDYVNRWTFYIELIRILPEQKDLVYPRFSKTMGPVPRELSSTQKQTPLEQPLIEVTFDEEEVIDEDFADFDQIEGDDAFYGEDAGELPDDFLDEK